jgi:hypothetical protein
LTNKGAFFQLFSLLSGSLSQEWAPYFRSKDGVFDSACIQSLLAILSHDHQVQSAE